MQEPHGYDRHGLSTQLYNYKLIFDVNSYLLENDPSLEEQISQSIQELETVLNELAKDGYMYTAADHPTLDQANDMLEKVRGLIEQMLSQDTSPYDGLESAS